MGTDFIETDGNGHGEFPTQLTGMLNRGSFDGAFTSHEIVSALKMLYDPGKKDEITKLIMRSDIPDMQFLFTFACTMEKCMAYNDEEGIEMLQIVLAGLPAVAHEKEYINRTLQVVRSIIGAAPGDEKHGGFWSKFRKSAGIGNEHG